MRKETDGREDGVVTYEGHVPNRMEEITVDCGLRDVEQAHTDERRIIACPVPLEAALVFFRFG